MSNIDWSVLFITIAAIVIYGIWKSRGQKNMQSFLLADRQMPWYSVCLSVMATQASAITFLSAPGQAFSDGMRFLQFYFGLPLAMIVLSITFIPIFHKLKVYTAYEYLEQRFDAKTRSLTALLFLVQRGLSTGITIYAPSIVLSHILGIDIRWSIGAIGGLVILYTVYGGTKAVSYTQMFQMAIIFSGLFMAAAIVISLLPEHVGVWKSLQLAGKMGKMNLLDLKWNPENKYNIWSGLIGGFFLQLSYFGTDQSQVGRYLTGSSVAQSRLGLIMNGIVKIPMQFFILLIGIFVFTFYQFHEAPVYFNQTQVEKVKNSIHAAAFNKEEEAYNLLYKDKISLSHQLSTALDIGENDQIDALTQQLKATDQKMLAHKTKAVDYIIQNDQLADKNDSNYVFLTFVTAYLPIGCVGLLIAIIFLASMGSTASGLNSLASTTVVDMYKRWMNTSANERHYLSASRWATVLWGIVCVGLAMLASRLGNLIEAVNILGSLFYGNILGIFLVAFYMKKVRGTAVFWAAIITEAIVIRCFQLEIVGYLWLNVIGCLVVMCLSYLLNRLFIVFEKKEDNDNIIMNDGG